MSLVLVRDKAQYYAIFAERNNQLTLPTFDVFPVDISLRLLQQQNRACLTIRDSTFLHELVRKSNLQLDENTQLRTFVFPIGLRANYLSNTVRLNHALFCMNLKPIRCNKDEWWQVCCFLMGCGHSAML
jgi:hypothetical protein